MCSQPKSGTRIKEVSYIPSRRVCYSFFLPSTSEFYLTIAQSATIPKTGTTGGPEIKKGKDDLEKIRLFIFLREKNNQKDTCRRVTSVLVC